MILVRMNAAQTPYRTSTILIHLEARESLFVFCILRCDAEINLSAKMIKNLKAATHVRRNAEMECIRSGKLSP